MPHMTGKATVYMDGARLEMENGAKASPGGVNRPDERHGGRTYFREEEVAPFVEGNILHTKDTEVIDLSNIVGATVIFETDTKHRYVMRGAFTAAPVEIDASSGKSAIKFVGDSFDRM